MHNAGEVRGGSSNGIFNTSGRDHKGPADKLSDAGIEFWGEVCSGGVVNLLPNDPGAV
jgi:hypothetical protein